MTEKTKTKRTPSGSTLKIRAFSKYQRAKDDVARREAAFKAASAKHAASIRKAQDAMAAAAKEYESLTGETLPGAG